VSRLEKTTKKTAGRFTYIKSRSSPLMQPKGKPPVCFPSTRFQRGQQLFHRSVAIALPRFGVLPCSPCVLVAGLARAPYSAQCCDAAGMPTAVKTIAAPLFAHPADTLRPRPRVDATGSL
jgi:hypothetical protein